MPSFLRDLMVRNVVISDEAIAELHATFLERITAHNQAVQDDKHKLTPFYIVRFDGRGYRTFSEGEAWRFYKSAGSVERLVLGAVSEMGLSSNNMLGGQIDIVLNAGSHTNSHVVIGGDSRDWVEATFSAFETALSRRRNLTTAVIRTQLTALVLQVLGVLVGVLLALWLAALTAPLLEGVEYPRAIAFAFWLLIYSNLWTYIQQRAIAGIWALFPNVRFNRSGDHWTHALLRKGLEAAGIGVSLWILGWLTKWASTVISPFLTGSI
jgi:AcrR family transcriptional regulator